MKARYISVFDLDHTLLKVNSSYCLGSFFYQHKFFPFSTMIYLAGCFWLHKIGLFSISKMQHKIFKSFFLGRTYSSISELTELFVDQYFDQMLYLPALERLKKAQQQGHYTVILSSSPGFLVELLAKRFQVDAWDATEYTLDENQRFCRINRLMLSSDKAHYINDLSANLTIEKSNIIAYSDSYHDLAFLEAAGQAVGVNPDRALKNICKQRKWPIL
jgi:HAD superfamily hydrolase (TIGR01490 family)